MAKIRSFFREHKNFIIAIFLLLCVYIMVYICSCFVVHPMLADAPTYQRVWKCFLLLMGLLFVGAVVLAAYLFWKNRETEVPWFKTATICVFVFGLVYMVVLPPMSAPDEIRHFLTAYRLSNQMMFQEQVAEERNVWLRMEDATLLLNDFPGHDDYYKMVFELTGKVDSTPTLFTEEGYVEGFWLAYLPQAIGITLARILHMRQIPLMLLGRFCNFLFWMAFFIFSVRTIPFGKQIVFLMAMLPMNLHLVSSMSYDTFVLALSLFFLSYVLHLSFAAGRVTKKDMAILTVVMALLAPVKIVYILLALLCFLIPAEKFGSKKNYWISAAVMAVAVAAVFLIIRLDKLVEYANGSNTQLSISEQGSYTLSYLFSRPKLMIQVFFNTLRLNLGTWYNDMLGFHLGWLEIMLPDILPVCFTVLLGFAAIRPADEPVYWKESQRVVAYLIVLLTAALTVFSMMVASTPADYPYAVGVQGRYFLPLLPIALLAFRSEHIRRSGKGMNTIIYGACLLNIWAVVSCIAFIMAREGVTQMLPPV